MRISSAFLTVLTCAAISFRVDGAHAQVRAVSYSDVRGDAHVGDVYSFEGAQRLVVVGDPQNGIAPARCIDWFRDSPGGMLSTAPSQWTMPAGVVALGAGAGGQDALWSISEIAALRTGENLPRHARTNELSAWVRSQSVDIGLFAFAADAGAVRSIAIEGGAIGIAQMAVPDIERVAAGAAQTPWSGEFVAVPAWLGAPASPAGGGVTLAVADGRFGLQAQMATFRRAASTGRYYGTATSRDHDALNEGALRAIANRRTLATRPFDRSRIRLEIQNGGRVPPAVRDHAVQHMGLSETATGSDVVMLVADGRSEIGGQLASLGNLQNTVVILVSCTGEESGIDVNVARAILRRHKLAAIAIYDGPVEGTVAIDAIRGVFDTVQPGATWDHVLQRLMQVDAGSIQMGVILSRLTIVTSQPSWG